MSYILYNIVGLWVDYIIRTFAASSRRSRGDVLVLGMVITW